MTTQPATDDQFQDYTWYNPHPYSGVCIRTTPGALTLGVKGWDRRASAPGYISVPLDADSIRSLAAKFAELAADLPDVPVVPAQDAEPASRMTRASDAREAVLADEDGGAEAPVVRLGGREERAAKAASLRDRLRSLASQASGLADAVAA